MCYNILEKLFNKINNFDNFCVTNVKTEEPKVKKAKTSQFSFDFRAGIKVSTRSSTRVQNEKPKK